MTAAPWPAPTAGAPAKVLRPVGVPQWELAARQRSAGEAEGAGERRGQRDALGGHQPRHGRRSPRRQTAARSHTHQRIARHRLPRRFGPHNPAFPEAQRHRPWRAGPAPTSTLQVLRDLLTPAERETSRRANDLLLPWTHAQENEFLAWASRRALQGSGQARRPPMAQEPDVPDWMLNHSSAIARCLAGPQTNTTRRRCRRDEIARTLTLCSPSALALRPA